MWLAGFKKLIQFPETEEAANIDCSNKYLYQKIHWVCYWLEYTKQWLSNSKIWLTGIIWGSLGYNQILNPCIPRLVYKRVKLMTKV